ncbi:hypothetical protein GDO81_003896 [Engystomops pustulosus]|uniref:Uncharacterized protein n=1 Tax=Engystomops pustulosus TaxID=76066 RepID=A0AAV7A9L8_ENGPU|nr:hypothetical protein GDO81_003896 [Engystomops pustulosus]
MSADVEGLLGRLRAEALVRGEDWLREKVAYILRDEDAEAGTPRASRVRPLEHRSPSPVPRNRRRTRSPNVDTSGAAAGHRPASEALHPGRNPFDSYADTRSFTSAFNWGDVDLRTSASTAPTAAPGITSMAHQGSSDAAWAQCYNRTIDQREVAGEWAQLHHRRGDTEVPTMAHSSGTAEESIELRIERLLKACSAATNSDHQKAPSRGGLPPQPPNKGPQPCSVWILGNSFVTSALKRVSFEPDGHQLGFPRSKAEIRWLELRNPSWDCVRTTAMHHARQDRRPPDILVLHAGGDDLGAIPMKYLMDGIKSDIARLISRFTKTIIVWSEIVNRQKWPKARSQKVIEKARFGVNKTVSRFLKNGGVVVRHKGLEGDNAHLFEEDGVRLNATGNDIWCGGIHDGIDKAIQLLQKRAENLQADCFQNLSIRAGKCLQVQT